MLPIFLYYIEPEQVLHEENIQEEIIQEEVNQKQEVVIQEEIIQKDEAKKLINISVGIFVILPIISLVIDYLLLIFKKLMVEYFLSRLQNSQDNKILYFMKKIFLVYPVDLISFLSLLLKILMIFSPFIVFFVVLYHHYSSEEKFLKYFSIFFIAWSFLYYGELRLRHGKSDLGTCGKIISNIIFRYYKYQKVCIHHDDTHNFSSVLFPISSSLFPTYNYCNLKKITNSKAEIRIINISILFDTKKDFHCRYLLSTFDKEYVTIKDFFETFNFQEYERIYREKRKINFSKKRSDRQKCELGSIMKYRGNPHYEICIIKCWETILFCIQKKEIKENKFQKFVLHFRNQTSPPYISTVNSNVIFYEILGKDNSLRDISHCNDSSLSTKPLPRNESVENIVFCMTKYGLPSEVMESFWKEMESFLNIPSSSIENIAEGIRKHQEELLEDTRFSYLVENKKKSISNFIQEVSQQELDSIPVFCHFWEKSKHNINKFLWQECKKKVHSILDFCSLWKTKKDIINEFIDDEKNKSTILEFLSLWEIKKELINDLLREIPHNTQIKKLLPDNTKICKEYDTSVCMLEFCYFWENQKKSINNFLEEISKRKLLSRLLLGEVTRFKLIDSSMYICRCNREECQCNNIIKEDEKLRRYMDVILKFDNLKRTWEGIIKDDIGKETIEQMKDYEKNVRFNEKNDAQNYWQWLKKYAIKELSNEKYPREFSEKLFVDNSLEKFFDYETDGYSSVEAIRKEISNSMEKRFSDIKNEFIEAIEEEEYDEKLITKLIIKIVRVKTQTTQDLRKSFLDPIIEDLNNLRKSFFTTENQRTEIRVQIKDLKPIINTLEKKENIIVFPHIKDQIKKIKKNEKEIKKIRNELLYYIELLDENCHTNKKSRSAHNKKNKNSVVMKINRRVHEEIEKIKRRISDTKYQSPQFAKNIKSLIEKRRELSKKKIIVLYYLLLLYNIDDSSQNIFSPDEELKKIYSIYNFTPEEKNTIKKNIETINTSKKKFTKKINIILNEIKEKLKIVNDAEVNLALVNQIENIEKKKNELKTQQCNIIFHIYKTLLSQKSRNNDFTWGGYILVYKEIMTTCIDYMEKKSNVFPNNIFFPSGWFFNGVEVVLEKYLYNPLQDGSLQRNYYYSVLNNIPLTHEKSIKEVMEDHFFSFFLPVCKERWKEYKNTIKILDTTMYEEENKEKTVPPSSLYEKKTVPKFSSTEELKKYQAHWSIRFLLWLEKKHYFYNITFFLAIALVLIINNSPKEPVSLEDCYKNTDNSNSFV